MSRARVRAIDAAIGLLSEERRALLDGEIPPPPYWHLRRDPLRIIARTSPAFYLKAAHGPAAAAAYERDAWLRVRDAELLDELRALEREREFLAAKPAVLWPGGASAARKDCAAAVAALRADRIPRSIVRVAERMTRDHGGDTSLDRGTLTRYLVTGVVEPWIELPEKYRT